MIVMVGREQGQVVLEVVPDVARKSLEPVMTRAIAPGSTVYTDSAKCYDFLDELGYHHESVNHSRGEYVRGEVHENGAEAIWSLFLPWLATFRGVSQDNLPAYVKVFQFLHNHRRLNAFERSMLVLKEMLEESSRQSAQAWQWQPLAPIALVAHPIVI